MENINFEVNSEIAKAYRNSNPEKQEAIKKVIHTFLKSILDSQDTNSILEEIDIDTQLDKQKTVNKDKKLIQKRQNPDNLRPASGQSFLRHKGTWKGEDSEECLQTVYDNRSKIEL
ncbi:MAG: hypothetical protein QNJ37_15190 [Crocosphaera sp.]|nr:hypothetical protein [Crocosphaera sp.]